MKTRRIKSLETYNKKPQIVNKIVVYNDSGVQIDCCVIHKKDDGKEYYYPSNPHDKLGLFTDKIKDAIECINDGYGDVVECERIFGFTMTHVVRFLDREYGEELRQKSIEGFKDAKFTFAIKFSYLNSFSDGRLILKNEELMGFQDTLKDVLVFDSEEKANSFIDKVIKEANRIKEEYLKLEKTGDDDYDYNNIISPFFDTIKGGCKNGHESVYWKAFSGLMNHENKADYQLKVVQIIIPEEEKQIES